MDIYNINITFAVPDFLDSKFLLCTTMVEQSTHNSVACTINKLVLYANYDHK